MGESAPLSPSPQRALGRRLADFRIADAPSPHGLLQAEETLLTAAAQGRPCETSKSRPAGRTDANCIRAEFVRFLLLGGDSQAAVHERCVEIRGAYIDGDLNLDSLCIERPLWMRHCLIEGRLTAHSSQLGGLRLVDCRIRGVSCHATRINGAVSLSDGFVCEGEVSFLGASINGRLNCAGGIFRNARGIAINGERAHISGSLILRDGFTAEGSVRFSGAEIGGQVACIQASLSNPGGLALNLGGARIAGSVYLSDGFSAHGKVRLQGAEIGRNLICSGGSFRNEEPSRWSSEGGGEFADYALSLTGARIAGEAWFAPFRKNGGPSLFEGSLDLQGASVGSFIDSPDSWPAASVVTEKRGELPCVIDLDGFTFDRFAFGAPTKADVRRQWLSRQRCAHMNSSFRPQPFEQLIKALRLMGHDMDARRIAIFKQEQLARIARSHGSLSGWVRPLYGVVAGYGYRPQRLALILFALWLGCAGLYLSAARNGGFAPADAQVWTNERLAAACRANWTTCPDVAASLEFNALAYSTDVLLPVANLNQRSAWTPSHSAVRAVAWTENLLGSLGVLLLGAILGGFIKRD